MRTTVINLIALFLLLLVTGVFWGTWFTLTRSIENFTAPEFIHIGKVIIANVAVPMRILVPSCIIMMGISSWLYAPKKSTGYYCSIMAFILVIIVLLVTLLVLVPIDNQVKRWTAETVPGDWETIRSRWQTFHTIRTYCSLVGFACFAWSVIKK